MKTCCNWIKISHFPSFPSLTSHSFLAPFLVMPSLIKHSSCSVLELSSHILLCSIYMNKVTNCASSDQISPLDSSLIFQAAYLIFPFGSPTDISNSLCLKTKSLSSTKLVPPGAFLILLDGIILSGAQATTLRYIWACHSLLSHLYPFPREILLVLCSTYT